MPRGKFFRRGEDKFFFKATRFRPASKPLALEEKLATRKRLEELYEAHTTAVVIADDEAEVLWDLVAQAGLYALLEVKIGRTNLFSRRALRTTISDLRKRAVSLRGHRGLIGFLLDWDVEPDALRARGLEPARARLVSITSEIREVDPQKMVAIKHRAGTVGLTLPEEDFLYAAMPALTPGELRSCVIRLHNLAEARPLVLEFGSMGPAKHEIISCAFGLGAAGVVLEEYEGGNCPPDRFKSGSLSLKMHDASERLPFSALNGACPPRPSRTPMVSVVICAYNAERTIRQCLQSLRQLDYPNFEVIVVDDGSRDATSQIAAEFSEFRLIRQPNKGLSTARNAGSHAALGELIAYTDSDCVVDPHWLTFMVRAVTEEHLDGCGGPNYAPHEDGWIEGCVAASPGAPCQVMIGDDRAEHLAGCNMVFKKAALEHVGGFDPQFTAAGDDVDMCWRLMAAGFVLGYCPWAFVWHFRRNTVQAYYRQQRGYGKAEAMLYCKYPERFNVLGQIKWKGTIPGVARTMPGGGRLRVQWRRAAEQFQRVDEMPLSVLAVAPMTAEWTLLASALLVLSLLSGVTLWPALAALAAGIFWAGHYAIRAPLEKCHRRMMSRPVIGFLAYSGSIARAFARYRGRADARMGGRFDNAPRQRATFDWKRRSLRLSYWNGAYTTREVMLDILRRLFASLGQPVITDSGWNDFDILVEPNPWARLYFRTAEEELGGLQLKTNIAARVRLSTRARVGLAGSIMAASIAWLLASPVAAMTMSALAAGLAISLVSGLVETASLAYYAVEQCASELNLVPLGKLLPPPSPSPITASADQKRPAEAVQPAGR
jgi:glycosyltransferase involved in cell wall biosynthesis